MSFLQGIVCKDVVELLQALQAIQPVLAIDCIRTTTGALLQCAGALLQCTSEACQRFFPHCQCFFLGARLGLVDLLHQGLVI